MADYALKFRLHAVQRMFECGITEKDVAYVIRSGEVIRQYVDDKPYPSRLLLGWIGTRPLHVVAADNHIDRETIVITVYEPDHRVWKDDFRSKRT